MNRFILAAIILMLIEITFLKSTFITPNKRYTITLGNILALIIIQLPVLYGGMVGIFAIPFSFLFFLLWLIFKPQYKNELIETIKDLYTLKIIKALLKIKVW